jgi:hypothetical protein
MSKTKIHFFFELMKHIGIKTKIYLLFSHAAALIEPGHEKQAVNTSRTRPKRDQVRISR